jgi:hypothetical protein
LRNIRACRGRVNPCSQPTHQPALVVAALADSDGRERRHDTGEDVGRQPGAQRRARDEGQRALKLRNRAHRPVLVIDCREQRRSTAGAGKRRHVGEFRALEGSDEGRVAAGGANRVDAVPRRFRRDAPDVTRREQYELVAAALLGLPAFEHLFAQPDQIDGVPLAERTGVVLTVAVFVGAGKCRTPESPRAR